MPTLLPRWFTGMASIINIPILRPSLYRHEVGNHIKFTRLHLGSLALRPISLSFRNSRPLITQTPLLRATKAYGQLLGRDFNPLAKLLLLRTNDPGDANNNYSTKAGFIGGGTVGYNWQIGKTPYLVGLECEYGYLGQKGGKTDPNAAAWNAANDGNDNSQSSTSIGADYGYGLVGGRLGYALDRSLIYIKSGAVFTTVNSSWSDTAYGYNGTSNKATTTGYALGAGFEYALPFKYFTNVSVKTEYLYFGIPTSNSLNTSTIYDVDLNTTQTTSGIHTAKIGVNYKF